MDETVLRVEFEAYKEKCDTEHRRLEDEDRRQNKRIDSLEAAMKEISDMSAGVRELAVEMRNMCDVQKLQGKRLEKLEARDGDKWSTAVKCFITAAISGLVAFVFFRLGLGG